MINKSMQKNINSEKNNNLNSIRICKTSTLGTAINIVIGIAIGGGVAAIQAFIRKQGVAASRRLFTRIVISKLTALGAKELSVSKVTIYSKLKKYNDKAVFKQGKKYVTEDLFKLIKEDLKVDINLIKMLELKISLKY